MEPMPDSEETLPIHERWDSDNNRYRWRVMVRGVIVGGSFGYTFNQGQQSAMIGFGKDAVAYGRYDWPDRPF